MICPYCGGEMEFGNIATSHPIYWIPGDNPGSIILNLEHAVTLVAKVFRTNTYPSYVCRKCRKLIADFPEVEQSEPLNNKEEDL